MSVTVTTAAWGNYWNTYGKRWTSFILKLDPQPTEVIVVSDRPIETNFKVVIEKDLHLSSFRNAGIKTANSEWIVPSDLDDEPFSNYVKDLDSQYDIIAYSLINHKDEVYSGNSKHWDDIYSTHSSNPIVGTSAVKRDLLLKTTYKKVGWEDWYLWLELKKLDPKVKFDTAIRFRYLRHSGGLSKKDKEKKDKEILDLKNQLK